MALGVSLLAAAALATGYWLLRGSLPQLDGAVRLAGVAEPVRIERDALGVVTVTASNRADLAFATGFAHAQDRFFQMDLARRLAAGELSELFGVAALPQDRQARLFRFRSVARLALALGTAEQRTLLEAYANGVNAGLSHLGARPWEYWVLRTQPAAWRPEDSFLVVYAMWWDLQAGDFRHEMLRRTLAERLGRAALQFLYPGTTQWDSPNVADEQALHADDARYAGLAVLPSAAELSVRSAALHSRSHVRLSSQTLLGREAAASDIGSNNWALAGRLTAHGAALVASDMHLSLRVPTTWYHARLRLMRSPGASTISGSDQPWLDLNGVTLPGAPLLVAGSNGQVAWAFTNTGGHWLDVRSLSCRRIGTHVLRTATADLRLASVAERIRVRGAQDFTLDVESAPTGVLFATDPHEQRCWFASWLAQLPSATNMNMLALEQARSAKEVLDLASELGIPHQNIVVGDRAGHIGWAIAGRIPVATAGSERFDGRAGWRTQATVPQLYDPPLGRVWSANARATDDSRDLEAIGGTDAEYGAQYALGARARQIRDALLAIAPPATPADMLRIQLDDRALFLARWRALILQLTATVPPRAAPERAELRRLIGAWDAHAAVDSVGYRLVRSCRDRIAGAVWHMLLEAQGIDSDEPPPAQFEQPLWALVTLKPLHLLAAQYSSWDQFLLTQIDASMAALRSSCGTLARCRWGEAHPVHVRHDFSRVLPALAPLLDMPLMELPGDHDMPRVQEGAFGASERFAVSPGHEAEGYLHIPGGASGHPLSPYYRAGFSEWAQGRALPLLPGPAQHGLLLQPLDRKVN